MNLYSYISRLETLLLSRQDIEVEMLTVKWTDNGANFRSEVRFYDDSRLSIFDMARQVGKRKIRHISYRFHYQDADGNLIFRYDNAAPCLRFCMTLGHSEHSGMYAVIFPGKHHFILHLSHLSHAERGSLFNILFLKYGTATCKFIPPLSL